MRRSIALAALIAAGCGYEAPMNAETVARDEFVRALAEREGVADHWSLMSRADVVFEDGFAETAVVEPEPSPRWTDVRPDGGVVRGIAARWIGPAAHLRVRGRGGAMALRIWGRIDLHRMYTRPRITATFDGRELSSQVIGDDGAFVIEAAIPAASLDGWSDVYLRLSSVHEPWRDAAALRVARVEGVSWEPAR